MPEFVPLYRYSLQNANEMDEVEQWRESHRENCKCANDITEAIRENYHNNRLEDCVQPLIDKYSFRRNDFYGVANDAALPEWAFERLNEIRENLAVDETDDITPEVSQS